MLLGIIGSNIGSPGKWHKDFKVALGLDLSSGTQATLRAATLKGGKAPSSDLMKQAVAIINNRVNASGNTGVTVQQQGATDIEVTAPGQGSQQLINNVSTPAQLRFRAGLLGGSSTPAATPSASATASPSPSASGSSSSPAKARPSASPGHPSAVNAATMKLFDKLDCSNLNTWKSKLGYTEQQWDDPDTQIVACGSGGVKYVLDKAVILGTDVTNEAAEIDTTNNQWVVNLSLNSKASKAFAALTTKQASSYYPSATSNADDSVLDQTAIVLDGNVVSALQTTEP